MLKYFKDSLKEFRHVNWPTRIETKKYLKIVVLTLTWFGIYLMIFWGIFSTIVFGVKDMVTPSTPVTSEPIDFSWADVQVTDKDWNPVDVNVETSPAENSNESTQETSTEETTNAPETPETQWN